MSIVRACALAVLLLLTGCSDGGGEAASPRPTGTTLPTPAPSTVSPTAPPVTTEQPQPSLEPAPQPPVQQPPASAGTGTACEQDPAAQRTCTFVDAVLTGAVTALTPPEQDVAARVNDLPPAPWGLTGCDLVGDVTVECQVVFSPPREQEVVATFVLPPVDGGYAVTDYLGAL